MDKYLFWKSTKAFSSHHQSFPWWLPRFDYFSNKTFETCCLLLSWWFLFAKKSHQEVSLLMSPKYTSLPFLTSLSNRLQLIFPPFLWQWCLLLFNKKKSRLASKNIAKILRMLWYNYRVQIGHKYKDIFRIRKKKC